MLLSFVLILSSLVAFGLGHAATVRLIARKAPAAWVFIVLLLWAGGAALGVYGGFYFEYHASPTVRVLGAPIPACFFVLEGPPGDQQWAAYPATTGLINAASNIVIVPLALVCLFGVSLWIRLKLRSPDA